MTAIELQSSLAKAIYGIHDPSLLEKVRIDIDKIVADNPKTGAASQKLTPKVRRMCFGRGLDDSLDERAILEDKLLRKEVSLKALLEADCK